MLSVEVVINDGVGKMVQLNNVAWSDLKQMKGLVCCWDHIALWFVFCIVEQHSGVWSIFSFSLVIP